MSETIDSLTIAFTEDGVEKIKELGKEVLSKGAWTTIIFRYQEWNAAKQIYSAPKFAIRRYQKRNDQYWLKSKFAISSPDQAQKIIDILTKWLEDN
ncbi:MAG TPA: hypothetical protein DCG13_05690 [Legionellales bacterium]|nr:hypothetical protein [Legionellales bacterium]HCA90244.1 hypothetical protein [Legionellales bacterium]|tara:strand:+ start:594 stop:881 length:288 start_codon:yes stop_codon:yes gene_type:complete